MDQLLITVDSVVVIAAIQLQVLYLPDRHPHYIWQLKACTQGILTWLQSEIHGLEASDSIIVMAATKLQVLHVSHSDCYMQQQSSSGHASGCWTLPVLHQRTLQVPFLCFDVLRTLI